MWPNPVQIRKTADRKTGKRHPLNSLRPSQPLPGVGCFAPLGQEVGPRGGGKRLSSEDVPTYPVRQRPNNGRGGAQGLHRGHDKRPEHRPLNRGIPVPGPERASSVSSLFEMPPVNHPTRKQAAGNALCRRRWSGWGIATCDPCPGEGLGCSEEVGLPRRAKAVGSCPARGPCRTEHESCVRRTQAGHSALLGGGLFERAGLSGWERGARFLPIRHCTGTRSPMTITRSRAYKTSPSA